MTTAAEPLPEDREHPVWTAHHEAGHAVAYLAYGLEFVDVTITPDPDEGHLGMVRREPTMTHDRVNGPITAAGLAAEVHLLWLDEPDKDPAYPDLGPSYVYGILRDNLGHHDEVTEAVELDGRALWTATSLVIDHWSAIAALAAALLARDPLTYAECRIITGLPAV